MINNVNFITMENILNFIINKNYFNLRNNERLRFKLRLYITSLLSIIYNFLPNPKLITIFKICLSDKSINHKNLYNLLQYSVKKRKIRNILEIGIGGHNKKYSGGHSLIALKNYFTNAKILGIDIINKKFLDDKRIKTLICSQSDKKKQNKIGKSYGPFDIIIDDGSHFSHHQKISFEVFFKHLKPGGIYVIEDIQGTYTKAWGGDPDLKEKNLVSFFSSKIHSVNLEYMNKKNIKKINSYKKIEKIFFIKNSIFIEKRNYIEKKYRTDISAYESLYEKNKRLNIGKTIDGFYNKKS